MLKIPRLAEHVFVFVSFLLFSNVVSVFVQGGVAAGSDRSSLERVLGYLIQLVTVFLIIVWHKRVFHILLKEKLLWILLAIALVSVLWSEQPSATIGNNQNLIRITLFGIYFGTRYTLKEQMQLLAWTFGITAVLSIVCVLVLPSYGVMGMNSVVNSETIAHTGTWQGIYGHKNYMGRAMVLSSLVFLLYTPTNRKYRWVAWAGFVLSVVLILGSTSKTSMIMLLTLVFLSLLYKSLRWKYHIVIPFLITLILVGGSVATVLVSNAESILGAFGRDVTLTGRTELWAAVLDKIGERPWLGYGFGGFWRGWDGESSNVWTIVMWEPPHSHDGYLDLCLDLGLLGFSAFVVSFILVCFRAVVCIRQTRNKEGLWPLTYLTFLFMANLTESSLFREESLWSLYVAVTLLTHNIKNNLEDSNAFYKQKLKGELMNQINP